MSVALRDCIKKALGVIDESDSEYLMGQLDSGVNDSYALGQLEKLINSDITALADRVESEGGEVKREVKDGRAFHDFFQGVTSGTTGIPGISADYKPVVGDVVQQLQDETSALYKYNQEYNLHKGNFDQHIALSIPGYRDFQYKIGNAILGTFDKGVMLDIGASEGTQAKTITSLSGGKIQSISLDPLPAMQGTFDSTSTVEGASFSLTALGMDKETEGDLAWNEDDGTPIHNFDPKGQQYDIVQESMVFQFIDNNRADHIKRAADLTKDDGIAIFQEKLHNPDWTKNEAQKNEFKSLSFRKEDMDDKSAEVLEGMNKNMVSVELLEQELRANFKHVAQIWDSGNFRGYAASNNFETIAKFQMNMGNTSSAFDTRMIDNAPPNVKPVFKTAVGLAKEHSRRSGTYYKAITEYVQLDVNLATRIAAEFEEMKHDPTNPEVLAAYNALIDESSEQLKLILDSGLDIDFIFGPDPYTTGPSEVLDDVVKNNHMWVYPTSEGHGSDNEFDSVDNPLLVPTDFEIKGHKLLANDVFRIVHDYFGHIKNGVGFRAVGEENAWQSHAAMFSPLARRALTTETRGQNTWLNYGPHGEANRTAKTADTVFADQKIGLLPEWASEEGRLSGDPANSKPMENSTGRDEKGVLKTLPVTDNMTQVVHFSPKDQLEMLDPTFYGNAAAGVEKERASDPNWTNRIYFGVQPNSKGGYRKEVSVGKNAYPVSIPSHLIYDMVADPDNIKGGLEKRTSTNYETAIHEAGYVGYWVSHPGLGMVGALFEPVQIVKSKTQPSVLYQSATLRDGTETLERFGLTPGKKYLTRDVAAALEARQRRKWGKIDSKDKSLKTQNKIARWMVEEILFELENPENSGVGWYSEKFQAGLDAFSQVFPELKDDKSARDTFTVLVALTSDGQKVQGNFAMAEDVYRNYRETGKFTTNKGTQRQASVTGNLKVLQELFDELGVEATHEYLMEEMKVGDLKKLAREAGKEFKSDYKVDVVMPRAALILGPKLGAFHANLMGADGYLTMDRWWSRTFNRYRGTLLQSVKGLSDNPNDSKGRPIGLARFKVLLGDSNLTDDEALSATVSHVKSYEAKNYKNGTDLEKAANTIYKAAFVNIEDAPFNAGDRSFMLDTVGQAAKILEKQGKPTSIADIQAILWYYEKKLYGELGARQTGKISYEEAANNIISDRAEGSVAQDGLGIDIPIGEETFKTSTRKNQTVLNQLGGTSLPMDEKSRLDRAKDMGFNVVTTWYHGTTKTFDQFKGLTFLTSSTSESSAYAGTRELYLSNAKDKQLGRIGKTTLPDNQLNVMVDYVGIISDIEQDEDRIPGKVWATDQGVIRFTEKGFDFVTNAEPDYNPKNDYVPGKAHIKSTDSTTAHDEYIDSIKDNYEGETDFGDGQVLPVFIKEGKYKKLEALQANKFGKRLQGKDTDTQELQDEIDGYIKEGYIGIETLSDEGVMFMGKDVPQRIVFDPANIRSVNAAFDPAESKNPKILSQPGYHRTPHNVDKFTTDKVGSMNGANFGHGMYFASAKEVADIYPGDNLYQVELAPEDHEYLRWNDPIEKQPEHIQQKFMAMFGRPVEFFQALDMTGEDMYGRAVREFGGDKEASEKLHEMGIRGIKYLDAGSRGPAGGSHNFVIFSDDDVAIVEQFEQFERGRIYLNDDSRTIQLLEASDLSTFLHEGAHLFLEMEKVFAKKYGLSKDQETMLEWLGADSFDDITVEMHEKWAETFESYLREGKAPSLSLRRAFASFARWLKVIYRSIRDQRLENADLTPEITEVFDRLLATSDEIAQAAANPAYDQYFRSKEQAGMSDAQWAEYQLRASKISQTAEMKLDEKAIKQYMNMKTSEWNDEKEPITERMKEDLSKERVHQVRSDLKVFKDDDGVAHEGRMDTKLLKEALGLKKLDGKLIGKHVKKGGVDPALMAESYEYPSVQAMYDDLVNAPTLKKASEDAAEAVMVEKYGDMLKDGTIEQEVREAMVNDDQAKMLLMEINALKKKARQPGINREYLKAQATTLIGGMKFSEIKPDKYYRQMVKAAQDAVTLEDPSNAKIQQLMNHYTYKEALRVKEQMTKDRKKVKGFQTRAYDTKKVAADYVQQIKMLSGMYDLRNKPEQLIQLGQIVDFYHAQRTALGGELTDLTMLDPNLIRAVEYREVNGGNLQGFELVQFDDLTAEDLKGVVDMLSHLRFVGGQIADEVSAETMLARTALAESIRSNGGKDHKLNRKTKTQGENLKRIWNHMYNTIPSLVNMVRKLDGMVGGGESFTKIYQLLAEGNAKKMDLNKQFYDEFKELMGDVSKVDLSRKDSQEFQLESGETWSFSSEEVFMMAVYWGTESSREAIMEGHGLTQGDVARILSTLTEPQLTLVNATWAMNESHWPELSQAAIALAGVAPPKLAAVGFNVNGIEMTGGHMQLMYDSQRLELSNEQESAMLTSSVMPTKHGSLNARVGSGGEPVNLDIGNITRSVDSKIHYIAFAKIGQQLRSLVNNKEIKGAIERKHGPGFFKAFIEGIEGVTGGRQANESHEGIAWAMRHTRSAASIMHLTYSIRNTMQQPAAMIIAMKEVGAGKFIKASGQLLTQRGKMVSEINSMSKFMENRATVVNRESKEFMKEMVSTSKMGAFWESFKSHGFIMQTMVDSTVAYPTWLAAYENAMEAHGDNARAITEADTSVAESVGSGSDLHLGRIFQSNQSEAVKTATMFGSWFNAYYQRLYRSSKGGTSYVNPQFALDALLIPFIVANLTQLLIMDTPDDDEELEEYLLKNTISFGLGTLPLVRDLSSLSAGFTPTSPITAIPKALYNVPKEINSYLGGDQTGLKALSDTGKALTGVIKVPGSGQLWRAIDYTNSYLEGDEGDFNIYQMLTEGKDKE